MNTPAIKSLRVMTPDDCRAHGVNAADYASPPQRLWLVEWDDRGGWYVEDLNPEDPSCRFYAEAPDGDTDIFPTAELAHAWLYAKLK